MAKIQLQAEGLHVDLELPSKYLLDTVRKLDKAITCLSELVGADVIGVIEVSFRKQED